MSTNKYIRKLSFRKLFNYLKLFTSFLISYVIKRPIVWGMPTVVAIEPTNICNLSCKECPTGMNMLKRPKANMNFDLFKQIILQIADKLTGVVLYFQGEPYLNKHLFEMIEFANSKNIYTYCSTNAHFLDNENIKNTINSGLDELIISLDGTTQAVYEAYRQNGNLEKVIDNSKRLVSIKKQENSLNPFVKFQFLVVKPNEHQIDEAKILAEKIGVDEIVFKTAQIYNYKYGNDLIPNNNRFSRYKKQEDGTYKIKNKLKNRCWRMWTNPVVTVDGSVIPCCFDKDAKYSMGNINTDSFKEIWNGGKYKKFRQQILNNRKSIDICMNCTEGMRV